MWAIDAEPAATLPVAGPIETFRCGLPPLLGRASPFAAIALLRNSLYRAGSVAMEILVRAIAFLALVTAGLLLTGCANYQVADRDAPVATFRFDYALGLSQYSIVGEDGCEKGARLAKFGAFDSSIKNVKVASGKPVRIKARTYFSGRLGSEPNWCESVAELTPRPNRSYRTRHYQPEDRRCVLKLGDEIDGAAPPDLVIQDNLPCPPITVSW